MPEQFGVMKVFLCLCPSCAISASYNYCIWYLCLHTQCECIILFLCVPDLHVTLLVRAVPIWWLKSFSYESMWNSRCVDVFSERELSQFSTTHCTAAARSCTLLLSTVINASASDFIKCLLPLAVHKLWAHDVHSLWHAWQASFVSAD